MPAALQTFGLVARPVPFFESCRRRFGETFSLRVLRAGELVFISDPPSLKRLFAADRRNTIAPGRNVVLKPLLGDQSLPCRRATNICGGASSCCRRSMASACAHTRP
jgi:hypothetical protein